MTSYMLLCAVVVSCMSAVARAAVPSSRSVYYLHTQPAPWAAARDTCERYGGSMVNVQDATSVLQDLTLLDTVLGWENTFSALTSDVWTGLHKFSSSEVMWHNCEAFTSATAPNTDIRSTLETSSDHCSAMKVADLLMAPQICSASLPYICHVHDGQCWFLPVEDTSLHATPSLTQAGQDIQGCAQICRNRVVNTTTPVQECWGFSVQGTTCNLWDDDTRHDFILNRDTHLKDEVNTTVYLKICAGGDITPMSPVTSDSSEQPDMDNCTGDSSTEAWDNGICYCDCDQPPVILEPEYLVLSTEEKVDRIIKELTVDPSNTSSAQRKLTSAEDNRPSSQSLGALGIALLVLVFGGLVVLDLNVLFSHIISRLKTGNIESAGSKSAQSKVTETQA